jgi:Ca-activated chloride channel family protein
MRTPLLFVTGLALVVAACGGATSGTPGYAEAPPDPGHHQPTAMPWPAPASTPYDGVTFDDPGVNPYVDPDEDQVSTFALDVDTASYTIAQRYVDDGNRPDPSSVRVEEWVNAFTQGYQSPDDETFAIVADGGPTPFTEADEVLLRIGLQARDVRDRAREDAALTFVIDTSGSMEREGRLELVKEALRLLVDELGRNDTVAIVTFGNDARVLLEPTRASDRSEILGVIGELRPDGSTNLEAGLRLGYGLARESMTENGIDRVVLASDGVANVGLTDPESILDAIRRDAEAGIELVSVGVGMGNFNDTLL